MWVRNVIERVKINRYFHINLYRSWTILCYFPIYSPLLLLRTERCKQNYPISLSKKNMGWMLKYDCLLVTFYHNKKTNEISSWKKNTSVIPPVCACYQSTLLIINYFIWNQRNFIVFDKHLTLDWRYKVLKWQNVLEESWKYTLKERRWSLICRSIYDWQYISIRILCR